MNNGCSPSQEYEISLRDYLWNLLMQWKAILLFCFLIAILISGAKYLKDSKAYDNYLSNKAAMEAEASLPKEERISAILSSLPSEKASEVLFAVEQQELINLQMKYLNGSIWLNIDPTSQRNLCLEYYIEKDKASDMQALCDSYSAYMRRPKVVKALRDVISPDAPLEYIFELITCSSGTISDSDVSSSILTITIVLPEHVDAEQITEITDASIKNISKDLSSILGEHRIKRINKEDFHAYSSVVADRRTNVSYAVNNLTNNLNNVKARMSGEQLAALEAINSVNSASDSAEAVPKETVNAPSFSKKLALLGFIMGAFIYAGAYLILSVLNKSIFSASNAQKCSGVRLLGELYAFDDNKGLKSLFSSKSLANRRYRKKLDLESQSEKAAATIDAVCSHHGIDRLTLLLSGIPANFNDIIDLLTKKCGSNGRKIELDVINTDDLDEKKMSDICNAVYALSNTSKTNQFSRLSSLCRDYGIAPLGTIYMEKL